MVDLELIRQLSDELAKSERASLEALSKPIFTLKEVVTAISVREVTIRNWLTRHQLPLDADQGRSGDSWRKFSPRDVVVILLADRITSFGYPISEFMRVFDIVRNEISNPYTLIAANIPSIITMYKDGRIIGPIKLRVLALDNETEDGFVVIRLDALVRRALDPLGITVTYGNASDHVAAAERLIARENHKVDGE